VAINFPGVNHGHGHRHWTTLYSQFPTLETVERFAASVIITMFLALEQAKSKACNTLFIFLVMPRVAQFSSTNSGLELN